MSTKDSAPVGAVLIVGGGISGMQSALDLGDSGFKVYCRAQPTIGGVMAQLDKTFPRTTARCASWRPSSWRRQAPQRRDHRQR